MARRYVNLQPEDSMVEAEPCHHHRYPSSDQVCPRFTDGTNFERADEVGGLDGNGLRDRCAKLTRDGES
ncbi:MAG TPA: hypothetical protein VMT45_06400 [Thermoanaerobaculaceae bacterium]|nr:hypothetical protein [Thermoanaerobaculaceae bacterium]